MPQKGMGSHQSARMKKDEWLTPPHKRITADDVRGAKKALEDHQIPQEYICSLPGFMANAAVKEFGGRLEPCKRPGLEAYDEIIEHNEGQGLIILVEKE